MRFVIIAFVMVLLAGFFHITFIMFDNVWYNDDNGVFKVLPAAFNDSMTPETRNSSWNTTKVLREAFGLGRVICICLVPLCLVLEAIDKPRIQG
jgi:hypothetical protein